MGFPHVRGEQIIYLAEISRPKDILFVVKLFTLGFCGNVMGCPGLVN